MHTRKCIVTSKILPVNQLIKFVKTKDGLICLQKETKILGRGAYCINDPLIINQLFEKKLLNKSFKTNINTQIYNKLRKEVDEYVKKQ